jgi:hypothetical protein
MTEPNTTWAEPEGTPPVTPPGGPFVAPVSPVSPAAPSAAPAPIVAPRKKGGRITNVLLVVAALIAVGGVTFAVGRATAPAASGLTGRGSGITNGAGVPGQGGLVPGGSFDPAAFPAAGGPGGFGDRTMTITGTVKSVDGTTLTITTESGTETTVDISGSTYHSQAAATAADVTAGTSVSVSVTGLGGFRGGPGSSAAPDASGAPGPGTITATDVTITAK